VVHRALRVAEAEVGGGRQRREVVLVAQEAAVEVFAGAAVAGSARGDVAVGAVAVVTQAADQAVELRQFMVSSA
jgi:hypothetical protein